VFRAGEHLLTGLLMLGPRAPALQPDFAGPMAEPKPTTRSSPTAGSPVAGSTCSACSGDYGRPR
jgi:hypothetical protein